MSVLDQNLAKTEAAYRSKLEVFFSAHYPSDFLTSHGLDHHRRVWGYAKELLRNMEPAQELNEKFTANLIVASYLHDIGMANEKGFRHGQHSRNYCQEFLKAEGLKTEYFKEALEVIEYHDRKDIFTGGNKLTLLQVLSTADDLDAFGYTGIFRYLEIYLARGIELTEAAKLIKENAALRFTNFESFIGKESPLMAKHYNRFRILVTYFEGLASELRQK